MTSHCNSIVLAQRLWGYVILDGALLRFLCVQVFACLLTEKHLPSVTAHSTIRKGIRETLSSSHEQGPALSGRPQMYS